MAKHADDFDVRTEDMLLEALDAAWERKRSSSTCGDCEHCITAPAVAMASHVKYMIWLVRTMYEKREDVVRTDESLEYEISRCCENARLLCSWCEEYEEFVDAEGMLSHSCEGFLPC